jgi:hypothetical protein
VCLFGAAVLLLKFNVGGILDIPQEKSPALISSAPTLPSLSPQQKVTAPHRGSSKGASRPTAESKHHMAESSSHPRPKLDSPDHVANTQANINPASERKTLKPLGYVQKADGTIEAIIPDGDGVQVVHVGDAYQEEYTVAKISPDGVEMVARAAQAPPPYAPRTVLATSTSSPAKSVGYVEKPDGSRVDVVAEGGSVALVQTAKTQVVSASNRATAPAVETAKTTHLPEPARTVQGKSAAPDPLEDHYQPTLAMNSAPNDNSVGQPAIPSGAVGFVEKADGKVQAIIKDDDGVRLAVVPGDQVATLAAALGALETDKGKETSTPSPSRADKLAGLRQDYDFPPVAVADSTPGPGVSLARPAGTFQARASAPREGEPPSTPQPPEQTDYSPPPPEVALVDDKVIPEKPPPGNATIIASFCNAPGAGESPNRSSVVLESLGIIGAQDGRASPEVATFDPAAPANGPPDTYAGVPSSIGYEDWQYGRASPLLANVELEPGAGESSGGPPTVLKSIGYIQWQDGRILAVLNDGNGGVRLVHAGEALDSQHEVGKVSADSVEITNLPHAKTSSSWVSPAVDVLPLRAGAGIALLAEALLIPAQPRTFPGASGKTDGAAHSPSAAPRLAPSSSRANCFRSHPPQGHSAQGNSSASGPAHAPAAAISSPPIRVPSAVHRIPW